MSNSACRAVSNSVWYFFKVGRSNTQLTYLLTYLLSHSRGTPLSHPHCPAGQLRSRVVGPEYVGHRWWGQGTRREGAGIGTLGLIHSSRNSNRKIGPPCNFEFFFNRTHHFSCFDAHVPTPDLAAPHRAADGRAAAAAPVRLADSDRDGWGPPSPGRTAPFGLRM